MLDWLEFDFSAELPKNNECAEHDQANTGPNDDFKRGGGHYRGTLDVQAQGA
jgi:hypothetical protein